MKAFIHYITCLFDLKAIKEQGVGVFCFNEGMVPSYGVVFSSLERQNVDFETQIV